MNTISNLISLIFFITLIQACNTGVSDSISEPLTTEKEAPKSSQRKTLVSNLPTIGILLFDGFLSTEVVAPLDVFTKKDASGKPLFNVVLIGKRMDPLTSEEGLTVVPDYTLQNAPELEVLIVPSSYHPEIQQKDTALLAFIAGQYETTKYMASHCAGAFLLAKSGVANDKKLVTYVTGGESLQTQFPKVLVQDDALNMVVEDGKIISSNGNLVSYIASLKLLEKMSSASHRNYVEEAIYLDRLLQFKSEIP